MIKIEKQPFQYKALSNNINSRGVTTQIYLRNGYVDVFLMFSHKDECDMIRTDQIFMTY